MAADVAPASDETPEETEFRALVERVQHVLPYELALDILKATYGVREVNGFEVVQGWTMPESPTPHPKWVPVAVFHGTDGVSLFWWDRESSRFPGTGPKDPRHYIEDPLVNPDAGWNYKACEQAYKELGFTLG